MLTQGYMATQVAATLAISRSSLYYQKRPRGSRADRTHDEQIVMACGEKLAYGYRRVAWWLQRKKGLLVNRKRVLRVMRERGLLVRSRRLRVTSPSFCTNSSERVYITAMRCEIEFGGATELQAAGAGGL
jgi:hypothetical protein